MQALLPVRAYRDIMLLKVLAKASRCCCILSESEACGGSACLKLAMHCYCYILSGSGHVRFCMVLTKGTA